MSLSDPEIDTPFRHYATLQLRRHHLMAEGREQAPELDSIEDEMTESWEKLDSVQRQSVNAMASDLNWIRRMGKPAPKGRQADDVTTEDRHNLTKSLNSKDWHRFLHYLRVCTPVIPAVNLAYLRGNAYSAIGFTEYASEFYELAARLDPTNASIGVIAIRAIASTDPAKAFRHAEHILANPDRFPSPVVAMSALMIMRRDEAEGRAIEKDRFALILNDAIERLPLEPPSDASQAMVYELAASGFEIIDDLPAALQCYEEGLRRSPDYEGLLIGKGLLLYGSKTDQAVVAFRRAISNEGSSHVWPYFFLAHHYLLQKNYATFLDIAQQALARAKTKEVHAQLLEWQAICSSELGHPHEIVRAWFEKAIALDPTNERIRRNWEEFEDAASARGLNWDIEAEETLRVDRAPRMSELEPLAVMSS